MVKILGLLRIAAIAGLAGFIILAIYDYQAGSSLKYRSGQVLSIDIPLSSSNFLIDLFSRAPIAALSLIPEQAQVSVGLKIFLGYFTRGLESKETAAIAASVKDIYNSISRIPDWNNLPPSTGYAALDLIGIAPQRAHAYIYIPKSADNNPENALIFLHGSLGNLKAYPYLWSKYAEDTKTIIICPSFGFGNWSRDEDIISNILEALPEALQVPRDHTIIAGLSAGGYGAAKEIIKHPDYQAAVFISAVIPDIVSGSGKTAEAWNKKPFLILNGTKDHLVTHEYAASREKQLSEFGAKLLLYPGESHFLLMTKYEDIFGFMRHNTYQNQH